MEVTVPASTIETGIRTTVGVGLIPVVTVFFALHVPIATGRVSAGGGAGIGFDAIAVIALLNPLGDDAVAAEA